MGWYEAVIISVVREIANAWNIFSAVLHRDKAICQPASWENLDCIPPRLATPYSRITCISSERARTYGDGICSGIPVGNSRRLRDYSRHPLREYIIARRVYVSSYDRHFRFRRALLTSFRFWTRKCVYVHTYVRIPIHITGRNVVRHCCRASCVTSVVPITDGFPEIFQEIESYRSAAHHPDGGRGRNFGTTRRTSEEESLTGKLSSFMQLPLWYLSLGKLTLRNTTLCIFSDL